MSEPWNTSAMKSPIWYTIWFLEALHVVCSTVKTKSIIYFALPYSKSFLWMEKSSRRPTELMFYISWYNSDRLISTLNIEHMCNFKKLF